MSDRIARLFTALSMVVLTIVFGCATGELPVVEKLDERTSVTITRSRTPIIMSPDTPYDRETPRDYVQIGAIEVNRMGTLRYYLWLGISDMEHMASDNLRPNGFESIVLSVGGEELRLDVLGWTAEAIGASEPVYKKIFPDSDDAYYRVKLDDIQSLTAVGALTLRTTGTKSKEFIPWYKQTTAKEDLAEFLRVVSQ